MMGTERKLEDSNRLQEKYITLAVSWGESLKIGDHKSANQQNKDLVKIANILRKNKLLGETILISLLSHKNPAVRLSASVDALNLGIHVQEAENVLIAIANNPNVHVLQSMAQINLSEWNKKKSNIQKDI